MTLETVLAWSTGRAFVVTSIALPIAVIIARAIAGSQLSANQRRILTAVALLPLFIPDLLTGFTYRLTSARLIHSVAATECLYALLLLVRIVAFQLAVLLILPSGEVTAESLHTWKMNNRRDGKWWNTWLRLQVAGPARASVVAWLGGAVLCFQEFETAALLQIDRYPIAWTVWLFDAHAAGEPLYRSLGFAAPAVAVQCLWLLPCLWLLICGPPLSTGEGSASNKGDNAFTVPAILVVIASLMIVVLWPLCCNGLEAIHGLQTFIEQGTLWQRSEQVLMSLAECAIAAFVALKVCFLIQRIQSRWLRLTFILPGLCGSLVLSLLLLTLFQFPLLNSVYDSWLPMLIGHILLMMPRAFLLVTVLNLLTPADSQHSVELLAAANHQTAVRSAGQLEWVLHKRKWLLALAVLTHWCFWEVTVAATLRPVRFEPIITRLYNEMHYGRTETLTAITAIAILLPLGVFFAIGWTWKRFTLLRTPENEADRNS